MTGAPAPRTRVAVVTGTRAEFGLLETVMLAIRSSPSLELKTIVAGAHFLKPSETWREVEAAFGIDARVPMQRDGEIGRLADAAALGRGVEGFAAAFAALDPDWVVVLGDRIEAFAAASAAAVGGIALAHIHGGDRAEGVADESMRHAITKLAHLHFPATSQSAERIARMGEDPGRVRIVGSPAVDALASVEPLNDARFESLGRPDTLFLMHPAGRDDETERAGAEAALRACTAHARRVLALMPNFDPGRTGVAQAIERSGVRVAAHLARGEWLGLLARVAGAGGLLVGNSSAGLIEAAALKPALRAVDIGPRQAGRERPASVVRVEQESQGAIAAGIAAALRLDIGGLRHPYGDGRAGERVGAALAEAGPPTASFLRKRNAY